MKPIIRLRSSAARVSLRFRIRWPFKVYVPVSYVSSIPKIFSNVDFPDPDAPIIETISPFSISKSMPFNTCKGAPLKYVLLIPSR